MGFEHWVTRLAVQFNCSSFLEELPVCVSSECLGKCTEIWRWKVSWRSQRWLWTQHSVLKSKISSFRWLFTSESSKCDVKVFILFSFLFILPSQSFQLVMFSDGGRADFLSSIQDKQTAEHKKVCRFDIYNVEKKIFFLLKVYVDFLYNTSFPIDFYIHFYFQFSSIIEIKKNCEYSCVSNYFLCLFVFCWDSWKCATIGSQIGLYLNYTIYFIPLELWMELFR